MTDQPPSQSPAEEPEGDQPAAIARDPAPPAPPAAFAPADAATAPLPPAAPTTTAPPPTTEPPFADASTGPSALAAAFPPDQPERAVGAAFAGGVVLALILKRLAR